MHLPEITEFGHRHERSSFCIRNNKEVLLPVCSISELQSGNKKPVKTLFQLDFHVCELLTFVGMCRKNSQISKSFLSYDNFKSWFSFNFLFSLT